MKRTIQAMLAAAALLAGAARADAITEAQARTVASNFTQSDATLRSCAPDAVSRRGGLFLVTLKPHGYVFVSATTCADPVPLFGATDFVEPAAGSPGAEMLAAIERDGAVDRTARFAARWAKLLAAGSTPRRHAVLAATAAEETSILLDLKTTWQQCQPFNDFAPVEYARGQSIESIYRGRRFAGCVPTAYVQMMNYWAWPEVSDEDTSEALTINRSRLDGESTIESVTPRIKHGTAFEWDKLLQQYPMDVTTAYGESTGAYDLRGSFSEAARLRIGRAYLLAMTLAKARYNPSGTGAQIYMPMRNRWYTDPVAIAHTAATEEEEFFDTVKASLRAGAPIMVSIDLADSDGTTIGHAVVGTGWQKIDGVNYFLLNYGWGGGSGSYSYASIRDKLASIIPNQKPRPRPILVNQPARAALPFALNWTFPKKGYDGDLTGFTVLAGEYGTTVADATDTFDENPGSASGDNPDTVFTGTYSGIGNDTPLLVVQPQGAYDTKTYYTWTEPRTLSAASHLTFDYRARQTKGIVAELQISRDGAAWEKIHDFELCADDLLDWKKVDLSLEGHAESSVRFRLVVTKTATSNWGWVETNPNGLMIDNFTVTEAVTLGETGTRALATVGPEARSADLSEGLAAGTRYALRVRANLTSGAGETSDYVAVNVIETAQPAPTITSVERVAAHTTTPDVQEDCFRECAHGLNHLVVKGNAALTKLNACVSHVSMIPDAKVTAAKASDGLFLVTIDASELPADLGRQRMILTLLGENADGAKVQRDLTLRFSDATAAEPTTLVSDIVEVDPEDPDPGDEPSDPEGDPDEPVEEAPVVTPTFPVAVDAGPNDDTSAGTRFCPGVKNAQSGVYDVTRTASGNYLIPAGHNLLYWWIDRYTTAKGAVPPDYVAQDTVDSSDGTYTLQSYTAALLDRALKTTLPAGSARQQYFPTAMTPVADWQDGAAADADKLIALGRRLYAALAKGPVGLHVLTYRTYGAVVWGCDYEESEGGPYATALYVTDTVLNTRSDTATRLELAMTSNNYASGAGLLNFSGTTSGIITHLYPISAPEPEAAGDGEVSVKVTALGQEFDISQAFSKVEKDAGGTVTYTLDTTPGKRIDVGGESIAIQPEFAHEDDEKPFEVQNGKLVFRVKSIPGLKYQVLASDSLDPAGFQPAGQAREATGTRRELTVTRSGETRGFYKIQVSR